MERIQFYTTLIEQLGRRATRAVLGLRGFRNDALREHLRALFDRDAGLPGAFLADPVFEASFGWRPAEQTLGGLEGKLLHPALVRALREPQRFPGGGTDSTVAAGVARLWPPPWRGPVYRHIGHAGGCQ